MGVAPILRTARLRSWAGWTGTSTYYSATGWVLTCLAVLELIWIPAASLWADVGVLVSAVSLVWRRVCPPIGFLTVAAGLVAFAADYSFYLVTIISGLCGVYTLARNRVQHPAVLVLGGLLGAVAVNLVHIATWPPIDGVAVPAIGERASLGLFAEAFILTVVVIGAVAMGDAVRARDETRRERARSQARLIAMERREAAAEERAAIARELHDIVAHSVSMIAVQAESATYTTPGLTVEAREGFQQIAGNARASMDELRRLLGVLRSPGEPGEVLTAPQPTLGHLPALLEQHRAVGGRAELTVIGERVALPAVWELSAYRIAQEALTNARKHAPGSRTLVEVDYGTDRLLVVRVQDDGPGPTRASPDWPDPPNSPIPPDSPDSPDSRGDGHGLNGMRERAALVGGRLTAGAGPAGGFTVVAELPW
ncbi:sensor histidine kinase [Streptomyces sp. NPDC059578]|uniref:sensor histidine kinase n=1 Tax=Streptomyces sp. NPDC059578 TaxID=3346874 RepID=UPI0036AC03DD